jgi:MinD-like ATPase involved in chromosome partitioning or flagellar assembly
VRKNFANGWFPPSGLRVLYSPQKIVDFKEIEAEQADAILQGLCRMADYTIVDLPPIPTEACIAAIKNCNYVGLVVAREPSSVRAGKRFLDHLQSCGVSASQVMAIVVSHAPLDSPLELRAVANQLGCSVLATVPPAPEALNRAHRMGTPLVIADPENPASVALTELAEKLAAENVTALRF